MKAALPFLFTLLTFTLSTAQDSLSFPRSWTGNWTGELEIYNASGLIQRVFMGLNIQPTDSAGVFTWEVTYGEGEEKQVRPYSLKTIDAKRGHYATDEHNSIILDSYWVAGKLIEVFSVEGTLLITTTQQLDENTLLWEIIVSSETPVATTGNTEIDGEKIPEVKSFPVPALQRALLTRVQSSNTK